MPSVTSLASILPTRRPRAGRPLAVAVLVALLLGLRPLPAAADLIDDFGVDGDPIWQTVGGEDPTEARGTVDAIAELNGIVYVGGWFTGIKADFFTTAETGQPYLAAFDAETGEPVTSFTPSLDGPVRAITPSADGTRLFVGGGFTSVNGDVTARGVAALDPLSGAVQTDWRSTLTYEWAAPDAEVRSIQLSADHLYVGGRFSHATSHTPNTRTRLDRIARLDLDDGRADPSWTPRATGGDVNDLELSADGTRLYAVGAFTAINQSSIAGGFAVVDLVSGALVPDVHQGGLFSFEEYIAVEADATHVFITGTLNRLEARHAATLEIDTYFKGDGDGQELLLTQDHLYWGGHFEEFIP